MHSRRSSCSIISLGCDIRNRRILVSDLENNSCYLNIHSKPKHAISLTGKGFLRLYPGFLYVHLVLRGKSFSSSRATAALNSRSKCCQDWITFDAKNAKFQGKCVASYSSRLTLMKIAVKTLEIFALTHS